MTKTLNLTVTTPLDVAVAQDGVVSIRAEDRSGGFGIWPGHADFLTVLDASVLRWRTGDDVWKFCALRGGVLRVDRGVEVKIACRDAVLGDDLARLESMVRMQEETADAAARRSRAEWTKLHTTAIRRLMRQLGTPGGTGDILEEDFR